VQEDLRLYLPCARLGLLAANEGKAGDIESGAIRYEHAGPATTGRWGLIQPPSHSALNRLPTERQEWWSYEPESRFNYLIWGIRRQMRAGDLLDWDNPAQEFTGYIEKLPESLGRGGAIRSAIGSLRRLAPTAAADQQLQALAQAMAAGAGDPAHKTHGQNKLDPAKGVQVLSMRYRPG
jgi:hypothetical protein